jgi:hypothetical protein
VKIHVIPEVKNDILSVLKEAVLCIKEDHLQDLSELSNQIIHNASIFQDEDSISIAVVIYATSKILQRDLSGKHKIIAKLVQSRESLQENDFHGYKKSIKELTKIISGMDSRLRLYIIEVINQAEIKKGSKIYDHGISLARAAEMLGISQWDLMTYIGNTQIIDRSEKVIRSQNRLKYARSLFGL